ncbi:hypothetical protein VKI22_13485 [Cyanobacterium aponinum UTEX 3221]|uniref:phosphorylase family protein n=1 Tax=Cyanobacterium aponinum TaxID=379064 RepID=UPI002B4C232E|nr:hypothetical protein [Cyanobacterium aponinum]WRL37626.1 hypothetical protein VKI22_13485 [Cyanobacterium aponinum UTEX 3221]
MIDYIFVCDGEELKALQKSLFSSDLKSKILPIPIGINPVNNLLKNNQIPKEKSILLIGLGGSLSLNYSVGDVVIYESCCYLDDDNLVTKNCDSQLNKYLRDRLNCPLVKGLTTDTLISQSSQKKSLFQKTSASIVDMESFALLNYFQSVSVIRVVSDNYDDDLPDLNSAITLDGKLNNGKVAIAFLKEPWKAVKLIKNALISLRKLSAIVQMLKN